MVYLNRQFHFKFIKGCLPQIFLGPLYNTLSQIWFSVESGNLQKIQKQPPEVF